MHIERQPAWADLYQGGEPYLPNGNRKLEEWQRQALSDPEFDYFDKVFGSPGSLGGMPKYIIGQYVQQAGVNVPLIKSPEQWQDVLDRGVAMLRSEHPQDYDGFGGLLRSKVLDQAYHYPRMTDGQPELPPDSNDHDYRWSPPEREYEGPLQAKLLVGPYRYGAEPYSSDEEDELIEGMRVGTINPASFMRENFWESEQYFQSALADERGYRLPSDLLEASSASRWEYIPGVNVRVFRDPVRNGRYYVGGDQSHHIWTVENGQAGALRAYRKHQEGNEQHFEYELPGDDIISLYEKVRTLPYFDARQAPVMEMRYGHDGKLYFLQYLKTGQIIQDPGEFSLPSGRNIVQVSDVRGFTSPEGERLQIYLDPRRLDGAMRDQGFYMDSNLSRGPAAQAASMVAKVAILNYWLSFKDNHFDSAPLYRPQVALGLWSVGSEVAAERFEAFGEREFRHSANETEYINAVVTSNGRQATIESDWEPRTRRL